MDRTGCVCEMHSPQHLAWADDGICEIRCCSVSRRWAQNAFTPVLQNGGTGLAKLCLRQKQLKQEEALF